MSNIKLEAMINKIREILSGTELTEWEFDKATKELLDLYNVSKRTEVFIVRCTLFGKGSVESVFSTEEKAEEYIAKENTRGLSILVSPIDVC